MLISRNQMEDADYIVCIWLAYGEGSNIVLSAIALLMLGVRCHPSTRAPSLSAPLEMADFSPTMHIHVEAGGTRVQHKAAGVASACTLARLHH